MTVRALLREITPQEFVYWMALSRIEARESEQRQVTQQAAASLQKWKDRKV